MGNSRNQIFMTHLYKNKYHNDKRLLHHSKLIEHILENQDCHRTIT